MYRLLRQIKEKNSGERSENIALHAPWGVERKVMKVLGME